MATQAEIIRGNIRANEARDMQRQADNGYGESQVEEVARGIPVNNDAALAAHLQEMRDTNQEYARLRTAEAREQWEQIAANNFRKTQEHKDAIQVQVAVAKMNQAVQDRAEGERLFSELDAIVRSVPDDVKAKLQGNAEDAYRLPGKALEELAKTSQKIFNLTGIDVLAPPQEQPRPQARPEAFPDGKPYKLTNLPDGQLEVQLITGERYQGDPIAVTQKLAESQVNTKRWGQQMRAQAQTQPQAQSQVQPQAETPNYSGSLSDDLAARQADALARQLGFSDKNEMMQWGETVNQKIAKVEQFEEQELAARFHATCPDFPDTQETAETVMQIIGSNGWQTNLESLQAAHALAIRNGLYQPLTAEQQQIANGAAPQMMRTTPPPMLRTNNPEMSYSQLSDKDLINLPSSELRKMAIAQELEGKGPHYR